MLSKWIGEIVGDLHVYGIEHRELAEEIGLTAEYVSMVFNGKRDPKGMEERMRAGIKAILEKREANT